MSFFYSYPRFTLGQLLVLIGLCGFLCWVRFQPGAHTRPLFSSTWVPTDLELANQSPLATFVSGNSISLIDCRNGKTIRRYTFQHRYPRKDAEKTVSVTFSPDDRFVEISSYIFDVEIRSHAITLIELATGHQTHWLGEREKEQPWPEVLYDVQGAKIRANGQIVATLAAPGPPPPLPSPALSLAWTHAKCRIWIPEWDNFFDGGKLVGPRLVDETVETSLETVRMGQNGETFAVKDELDRLEPVLFDARTGDRIMPEFSFDPNVELRMENIGRLSYFVIGSQVSTPKNKLGIEQDIICWNLKTGQQFALPSWASIPNHWAWALQVREFDGELLVSDGATRLTWVDTKTGATRDVFNSNLWHFDYGREGMLAAWAIAWFAVTRKAAEDDHSRVLGYLLAATTVFAILSPAFDWLGFNQWRLKGQWLLSIGCLSPLTFGLFASAMRRTASLPLLVFTAAILALLFVGWFHDGTALDGNISTFETIRLATENDYLDDEEFDLLRPWRFGAPPPDKVPRLQFRDKLEIIDEAF